MSISYARFGSQDGAEEEEEENERIRVRGLRTESENDVQGPKQWFAKCDTPYPSRSGQTSLATADSSSKFHQPTYKPFFRPL